MTLTDETALELDMLGIGMRLPHLPLGAGAGHAPVFEVIADIPLLGADHELLHNIVALVFAGAADFLPIGR